MGLLVACPPLCWFWMPAITKDPRAQLANRLPAYFFGNDEKDTCRYANGDGKCDGYAYSSPVGKFAQNGFGLYDMHGNAWQCVGDCWHDSYSWAPSDGAAWTSGDCRERVLRGGSWGNSPGDLRSALRYRYLTLVRYNINGFRLGRTLTP